MQEPSSAEIAYDERRDRSPISRKAIGSGSRHGSGTYPVNFGYTESSMDGTQGQVTAGQADPSMDAHFDDMQRSFSDISLERVRQNTSTPTIHLNGLEESREDENLQEHQQLHYHHERFEKPRRKPVERTSLDSSSDGHTRSFSGPGSQLDPRASTMRPQSGLTLGAELYNHKRGRSLTPADVKAGHVSLSPSGRSASSGRSPDHRPVSYVDQLNDVSYRQQMAQQNLTLDNARLRSSIGANASLLDTKKTLDMYRANVKKTTDLKLQYEFAVFLIQMAQQSAIAQAESGTASPQPGISDSQELVREARDILARCADRGYPFAQYYLADGYASGLFNRGREDNERAFALFVSAAKHGHAEAAYRAALSYEFGWGTRRDYAKAVQYYQQAAAKSHPGAATRLGKACLLGEMGLGNRYREGIRWLKRATENADTQHNIAPYELGVLHTTGYGDDVFKDETYAAQLFTHAAELGHPEANLMMGEAYEYGLLNCPKDPALSIHFYTGAAQSGVPKAMMALCAWYMVGAEPVLEKDEAEAYEWAKRSAKAGMFPSPLLHNPS